jgi:hypothetical protein
MSFYSACTAGYLMTNQTMIHASVATPTLQAKTSGKSTAHPRLRRAGDGSDGTALSLFM